MAYEELKARIKEAPISSIIERYRVLVRKGSSTVALCPFHQDSKPSMNVNDSKNMFKCFACGAGGDAIKFVMDFKNLDFVEALKECAGILGIPFEEHQKERNKNPKIEMAFRVLNASLKLYKKVAEQNPPPYLEFMEKRKLLPETVEKFEICYAPSGNALYRYLQTIPASDRNFAIQIAKEIRIIGYNEDRNSHYDFFRERIVFPVYDHHKQLRGYQTRAVLPQQKQKYMNSVESFVFDKGSIMFGYYLAKPSIRERDQVFIAEGNMDVVMMHQHGFTNTIGTMGTAMSDQSVRLLSNLTKNVFFAMDSDDAGKRAMSRINVNFLTHGVLPKVINFSPAKDPDEFLLTQGKLALVERIEKAPVLIDVLIEEAMGDKIPENLDHKLGILHRIFEIISPLKEHLSASERIVTAAKTLGLKSDPATILEDYKDYLSRQKEKTPALAERPKLQEVEENIEMAETKARNLQELSSSEEVRPLSKSERLFTREILCHPEFLTHLNLDELLAYIEHDEVKSLVQWLVNIYSEIDDAEYVNIVQDELQYGSYGKEIKDIGTDALFNYGNPYNEKVIQRMLKDYKLMLQMEQLKTKRKELVQRQKSSQSQSEIDLILSEISKLDKEIHHLKSTDP